MNVLRVLSGEMQHRLVERRQDESFAHRKSKQVSVRDLIVSVDTL